MRSVGATLGGHVKTRSPVTRVEHFRMKCASRESNHAAHPRLHTVLENCIFHIFPMYEFSHSLLVVARSRDECDAYEGRHKPCPYEAGWLRRASSPLARRAI